MSFKSAVTIFLAALAVAACSSNSSVEVAGGPDPAAGLLRVAELSNSALPGSVHRTGDLEGDKLNCTAAMCYGGEHVIGANSTAQFLADNGVEEDGRIGDVDLFVSNTADGDWQGFGAWMDHSAFLVYRTERAGLLGAEYHLMGNLAFGQALDTPLPAKGTATWQGAMVGVNINTTDRYAGEANLVASFDEYATMDVSFTSIANVETGAPREDILFRDMVSVGLYESGQFFAWAGHANLQQAPIYIDGQLFGPNHEEATGVFKYNELVGAFGARKQE